MLFVLWGHSSMTWHDLVIFLPKPAKMKPHKQCKISARSSQRLGVHFRTSHGDTTINRSSTDDDYQFMANRCPENGELYLPSNFLFFPRNFCAFQTLEPLLMLNSRETFWGAYKLANPHQHQHKVHANFNSSVKTLGAPKMNQSTSPPQKKIQKIGPYLCWPGCIQGSLLINLD